MALTNLIADAPNDAKVDISIDKNITSLDINIFDFREVLITTLELKTLFL